MCAAAIDRAAPEPGAGGRIRGRDALDAIVAAELDRVLARRPRPSTDPEIGEALFLEQASAFLARHADPLRLIALLRERLPQTAPPPPPPAPAFADEADAAEDRGSEETPS